MNRACFPYRIVWLSLALALLLVALAPVGAVYSQTSEVSETSEVSDAPGRRSEDDDYG